jgi:hypothetical protein
MDYHDDMAARAVEAVRERSKRLNLILVLIIFLVLFLIVRYLYGFLDYLPLGSAITLMTIIAALAVATFLIARSSTDRALRAMEEYGRRIKALLATTRGIQEIGYSDVLLENILDIAVEMTRADGGSLILIEGDKLQFRIVRGPGAEKLLGLEMKKGQGLVGWVVENSTAVRVSDTRGDTRFSAAADKLSGFETLSVLCVPLVSGAHAIGAIELVSREAGAFAIEDEEIMKHFAAQSALSFAHARRSENEKNYKIHLTNILVEAIENTSNKHGHARRIARYTLLMADAIGMSEEDKEKLYRASMLLDIGFLKIHMQDVHSAEEYKTHAKLAYEMLIPIAFYQDVVPLILHHHERWNGMGYPVGLAGETIPLGSRILAIAEAFDAMVSESSYKNVDRVINREVTPHIVPVADALEELMRHAGTQFDPELVDLFVTAVREDEGC